MTKEELLQSALELMKTMTPEERGQLVSDMLQLSLNLTLSESLSAGVRNIIKEDEKKVS